LKPNALSGFRRNLAAQLQTPPVKYAPGIAFHGLPHEIRSKFYQGVNPGRFRNNRLALCRHLLQPQLQLCNLKEPFSPKRTVPLHLATVSKGETQNVTSFSFNNFSYNPPGSLAVLFVIFRR